MKKINCFGLGYFVREIFDTDKLGGIEVSDEDETVIGEIWGLSLPDFNDADEVSKFEDEVSDWLETHE